MITNKTVTNQHTTLISAGPGVRLANVGIYFCNKGNQPNVVSIHALSSGAAPSDSNVLAYNVSISPSETFYFGQEKFILDDGEKLVAKAGMNSIIATLTFMSIGDTSYVSTGVAEAVIFMGEVVGVVVVNGGSGYTEVPVISFSGGGGADATATATINAAGELKTIEVTDGGSGYTTAPTVGIG